MRLLLASVLMIICLLSSVAHATINLGTIGDSLTDEYLAGAPGDRAAVDLAAWSWVQILAATRSSYINFGMYKPDPLNNWGGTRDTGYEYNWAKSGAVAADQTKMQVIGFGKLSVTVFNSDYASTESIGLASQISGGIIDTVFIGIGSNDFYFRCNLLDTSGNETPIPLENLNLPLATTEVTTGIINAIDSALAAGNVNMLVALVAVREQGGTDARSLAIIAAADAVNANITQAVADRVAAGKSIALVNLWSWATNPLDPHHRAPDGSLSIGALAITNTAANPMVMMGDVAWAGTPGASTTLCKSNGTCATAQHSTHFMTEPHEHPNTAIQALLANQIISALNANFAAGIPLLSDSEIENLVPDIDTDLDGIGNKLDPDDDNDGVLDSVDNCPAAVGLSSDQTNTDGDAQGNVCDEDDDNDDVLDVNDAFPLDPTESLDSDSDGVGNNIDADDDADGLDDNVDNCPASFAAGTDQANTDGDAQGDLCDIDDDNDGALDVNDAFQLDPAESLDTDNDGTGNNADADDDADSVLDITDNCPVSFELSADQMNTDGDAQGNVCDVDDDNDTVFDVADQFPLHVAASQDVDVDSSPDSWNTACNAACQTISGLVLDNCLLIANVDQLNTDGDDEGNACDTDDDNDGVTDITELALGTDVLNPASGPEVLTTISFENGVPVGWVKPATANTIWITDAITATHLSKSLRSGMITHNQKTQIEMTVPFYVGEFSFDVKLSTEINKDVFRVYVDGVSKAALTGEVGWQKIIVPITASGMHTVRFDYSKNFSITSGGDAVWIDNFVYVDGRDTDSDSVIDLLDPDIDGDGVSNALDWDDDGDAVPDSVDADPLNPALVAELILPLDGTHNGAKISGSVRSQ